MSKIIFFGVPAFGHVNPTLPVVAELVRRGHEVVYYNAPSFQTQIERNGAEFRQYPDGNHLEKQLHDRLHNLVLVTVLLLEENMRMLPFALAEIDAEKPGVILFDSLALWGMQAARLRSIPSVSSISTMVWEGVKGTVNLRDGLKLARLALPNLPALLRARRAIVRQYGPDVFPRSTIMPGIGTRTLVYTSRELQPNTQFIDHSFYFVGTSIHETTRIEIDFPWDQLHPEKKKIYISLGTLYHENEAFLHTIFEAFADFPAQMVFSTGSALDLNRVRIIPDNFILRPSVPQLALLPKVDLFITHGGMNSMSESLYFGTPMVIVPQQLEQALNGRLADEKGAGIVLADRPPYGHVDAQTLRSAADTVLNDESFAKKADFLGESLKKAGGYKRAADIILEAIPETSP